MIFAEPDAFAERYSCEHFLFQGKEAVVVKPSGASNGFLVLKTMYFGVFPELEMHLLDIGYHVAYVDSDGRFGRENDLERMAAFIPFVTNAYGLYEKAVLIGMSAGGACAIKLAALYPNLIGVMYLDNPVVNVLSCPMGFGSSISKEDPEGKEELLRYLALDRNSILSYRLGPIDHLEELLHARIPAVLVYGTDDRLVPFCENAKLVSDLYRANNLPILIIPKEGFGHHPHGIQDDKDVIEFFIKHQA